MQTTSASILVIEDNPTNLNLLFTLLNDAGFEVLVSLDGESALHSATANHPDMILLDVIMNGIDGFETCRRLKSSEKTREIPIIFMTALARTEDKVNAFKLGAVDYITKPIEPEEVLMRVRTHLTLQALQRNLQAKNRELQASFEREQELSTLKSRFISIASHELRTPLTSILFSTKLLMRYMQPLSPTDQGSEITAELESIEQTIQQMNGTLDEVLTISKSEAGRVVFQPVSTDLASLCRQIIEKFRLQAAETHDIVFSPPSHVIQAQVDQKLIEQVLSNLLSNAMKYSPDGGTISCVLERNGAQVTLSVSDQGIGIKVEDQPHLFEAFYRGGNVKDISGTGLGLSIVKQFVELHQGTLTVESQPGKSTTFTITLPLSSSSPQSSVTPTP